MQINLSSRHLRAFVALAEQRNFTRAAKQCHLSQPAFSAVIRTLEQTAGARLFDRHTRNVELTPEGRLLEESVSRLLADFDGTFDDLRNHIAGHAGRVAVAALPSLAAGWLAPVLAAYRAAHPGVAIELFDLLSDACLDLVRRGRADLALTAAGPDMADLEAEVLCTDHFHLVCHRDHPLARAKQVRLPDLGGHPFVHMARTSSVRQHLDAALHPARLLSLMEVEQLATLAGLIASGIGISVVPSLTLFHFQSPELVVRPLQAPALVRTIYIVRRKGASLSSAAQFMLDLIRSREPAGQGVSSGSGGSARKLNSARKRGRLSVQSMR